MRPLPLTKRERVLLECMMQQLNKVVTFDSITDLIWEDEAYDVAIQLTQPSSKKT